MGNKIYLIKLNDDLFPWLRQFCEHVLYRNIEGKVVEIAKLQEVFTEKVLEQVTI